MNKEQATEQELGNNQPMDQELKSPVIDELKLSSEIEASEQKPLEENVVEKLSAELAEQKDLNLRLYAEFENFKKRSLKERMELIKSAGSDVIINMLPVLDDFERAVKATVSMDEKDPLREGLVLVYNKFRQTLEQKGLKAMDAIGAAFDVDLHEAITTVPTDDSKKGMVTDEIEKGYLFNDKVIRHAKVVVGA